MWLSTAVSVGAEHLNATPLTDPEVTLSVPVMPRSLNAETPICISAPLLPPINVTKVMEFAPTSGTLVETALDGLNSYILIGFDWRGPQPLLRARRPQSFDRPVKTYRVVGPAAIWEPPTPGVETMIVSFKSRYFNETHYSSWYAYTVKKLDFPNGTDEIEFYLTNATSRSGYYVEINVYDESGSSLLYSKYGWVYVDGSQPIYLGVSANLYSVGLSSQPVKVAFWVYGVAGKTIDAVIYARVRVSRYINSYVSVGAKDVIVGYDSHNIHLVKYGNYILVPSVIPALGHIDGSGTFQLSVTYRRWNELNPPQSITIYAYYGDMLIGSSTAYRSGSYPYYEYHFTSWSWSCPNCAVKAVLRTMGADGYILIGPFPQIGFWNPGEKDVVIHDVRLVGAFRPEMNRPRSWIYRNAASSWLIAHISDYYTYPEEPPYGYHGASSIVSLRLDTSGGRTDAPKIAITLLPYRSSNHRYHLFKRYTLTFVSTAPISDYEYHYWVEDLTARRLLRFLSPLVTVINIISEIIRELKVPRVLGLAAFVARTALETAVGNVDVYVEQGTQAIVKINVGWAEMGMPQGVSMVFDIGAAGLTSCSFTLARIETSLNGLSGKDIYVGATANIDRRISNIPINSSIDRYRTLYCGYQEEEPTMEYTYKCTPGEKAR